MQHEGVSLPTDEASISVTELQIVNFYQFRCKDRKMWNNNAENIRCHYEKFN
jgi:hypothetical protein